MDDVRARPCDWTQRTPADLSGLLVELSRSLKGHRFYSPVHPALRDILDRAFLAWQVEIERAGPIELVLIEDGICCVGVLERQPLEATLGRQLRLHDVAELRASEELTRPAFVSLVAVLAREPEDLEGDLAAELGRLPATRAGGIEIRCGGTAEASAASRVEEPAEIPALADPPPTEAPAEPKQHIDEAPLDAAAGDSGSERLRQCLRQLEGCVAGSDYETLIERAAALADGLADRGALDEGHRAMIVFSDHASSQGGRTGAQQERARTALEQFARGPRLRELIDRAALAADGSGIRAAQILLQLGQRTIGPILQALETEGEPERIAQLSAIVVALGERGEPALRAAIEHGPVACARIAVRLAGELQSPDLLATLISVLEGHRNELAREAARALVVTGSDEAVSALCRALSNRDAELAELAAYCLGATRSPRAVDPLLATLDRATRGHRPNLARACIRSLGQLGSDRATPKLVAIVERKRMFQRKRQRALKLAALTALAQLPCHEAQRAITRARTSRDSALRQHAEQLRSSA